LPAAQHPGHLRAGDHQCEHRDHRGPLQPGFVCVNITNGSTIPVKVALYRHNGFDPSNKCGTTSLFSCCTNPNSTVACPCPCQGAQTGECKLGRDDLFTGCSFDPPTANLYKIDGANYVALEPAQSAAQQRIRCGDVKTLGAAVSRGGAADDPVTAPVDQNGPVYRDEPGGVACDGTVLFQVIDLNNTNTGNTTSDLVTLAIQAQFSQ
jgi:hypothetical protein